MKIIPIFFYHEKWAVIMRKFVYSPDGVEKMGPLRGDGKFFFCFMCFADSKVEKMGPLRGDGKVIISIFIPVCNYRREDGSPSWGRKAIQLFNM